MEESKERKPIRSGERDGLEERENIEELKRERENI